jgi:hypothetical protein
MARRKQVIIDGENRPIGSDSTIRTVLEEAGRPNVPSVVSNGEVITPIDYDRPAPPHGMTTNARPLEKGASLREHLLDQEFDLIASFLSEFSGRTRTLELNDSYLLIRSFPLPDDYNPDHIDLLLVISRYPDAPPGAYIPAKSPNCNQITEHLGGHVMTDYIPSGYRKEFEEAKKLVGSAWNWVCYHYVDYSWELKPNNLLSGDYLYKYCENLFAALSGGHRD